MTRNYQHVIWDWNGTLLNDAWLCVDVMNQMLYKYHKPALSLARYHEIFDFPVQDYYLRLGFNFDETPFEEIGMEFMAGYFERWRRCQLQIHARDILQNNAQAGVTQSVLSAMSIDLLREHAAYFQIDAFFGTLSGLNHHYATGKLDLAHEFMQQSGLDPRKVVIIGDTTHDFQVSQALGTDCILFSGGHHPRYKLEQCGVPIVDDYQELPPFLQSSNFDKLISLP